MYTQVTKSSFIQAFATSPTYKDNFSYEGLEALFDYLENLEDETDTKVEFDMVSICCEYSEFASIKDAFISYKSEADYNDLCEFNQGDDEDIVNEIRNEKALEYLKDNTSVIEIEGNEVIIIRDF